MDNHPVLREMQDIGCCDISQVDLAFQVYMELCEANLMWDVSHRYIAELDLILLSARRKKDSELEMFVPVAASADMNLEWLELLQETIGVPSEHGTKLTLAIVDSDSTVVLHELTRGLVPPNPEKRRRHKLDPATFLAAELEEAATSRSLEDSSADA